MNHSAKILAAAAAIVLFSTPAFAHNHEGHKAGHAAGNCPHHQAIETTVGKALALVNQASAQTGAQAKTTLDQARQQLTEAQKHMDACEQMCQTKMGQGGHEGHEDHKAQHGGHAGHDGHAGNTAAATAQAKPEQVVDPVCGMKIDPKTAAGKSVYAGKTYYFCSADEKAKFDKDPEKYLKKG